MPDRLSKSVVCSLALLASAPAAAGTAEDIVAIQEKMVDRAIADASPAQDGDGSDPDCTPGKVGEVVVCGRRGKAYRLDPDIMATVDRDAPPRTDPRRTVHAPSCREGPNGCPGAGAIPVTAIALKVAQAGLAAAKGDDWKQVFSTGPDSYERYRRAKARRQAGN